MTVRCIDNDFLVYKCINFSNHKKTPINLKQDLEIWLRDFKTVLDFDVGLRIDFGVPSWLLTSLSIWVQVLKGYVA